MIVSYTGLALIAVSVVLLCLLIVEGHIVYPHLWHAYFIREKIYPIKTVVDKDCSLGLFPLMDWNIRKPNVTLNIIVTGGMGSNLMAFAAGVEACRQFGLRLPTIIVEDKGDFDYHNMTPAKHGWAPTSMSDILPWTNVLALNSAVSPLLTFCDKKIWTAKSTNDFIYSRNVFQFTMYKDVMPVSDEAFDFVRRCVTTEAFSYIDKYYGSLEGVMAVHLRLGQPSDEFRPPCPDVQDIMEHYNKNKPTRVLIFTDNKPRARAFLKTLSVNNVTWISECPLFEMLMIGMCSSAIISHSTFSVVGCRMFKSKQVAISIPRPPITFKNMFDPEWKLIRKNKDAKLPL